MFVVKNTAMFVAYDAGIRHQDVITLNFAQDGGAYAALPASEHYHEFLCHILLYLSKVLNYPTRIFLKS